MPKKKTHEEFLVDAHGIHGDNYEYPDEYKGSHVKIEIVCKVKGHGPFRMKASSHTNLKQGCPKCGKKSATAKIAKKRRTDPKEFKRRVMEKFPELDFSKTNYVNSRSQVIVTCLNPDHGDFPIIANNLLLFSKGCPKCVADRVGKSQRLSQEEVLSRVYDKFGDKFDTSLLDYRGRGENITLVCRSKGHGPFDIALKHIESSTYGCPKCWNEATRSKNEEHLERILKEEFPNLTIQTNNRSLLEGYEVDIYIPEVKLAIEWNGIYWHSLKKVKKTDAMKRERLGDNLIQISDTGHESVDFVKEKVDKVIRPKIEAKLSQNETQGLNNLELVHNYLVMSKNSNFKTQNSENLVVSELSQGETVGLTKLDLAL